MADLRMVTVKLVEAVLAQLQQLHKVLGHRRE
jgi:hypothetical protein